MAMDISISRWSGSLAEQDRVRGLFCRHLAALPSDDSLDVALAQSFNTFDTVEWHCESESVVLTTEMRQRFKGFSSLTAGARKLLDVAVTVDDAVKVVLSDRGVKSYLRESVKTGKPRQLLSKVLHSVELDEWQATPSAVNSARFSLLSGLDKKPQRNWSFFRKRRSIFANYLSYSFSYKSGQERPMITVGELLDLLENYTSEHGSKARSALAGLLSSDVRFLIVHVMRMSSSGELIVPKEVVPLIKVFAARFYVQLNAIESASTIVDSLLSDSATLSLLPSGEIKRLRSMRARCMMRGGRGAESIVSYRSLMMEYPQDPEFMLGYIVAVAPDNPDEANAYAKILYRAGYEISDSDQIYVGDILANTGSRDEALMVFHSMLRKNPKLIEPYLGLANLALLRGQPEQWPDWINRYFAVQKLPTLKVNRSEACAPFRFECPSPTCRDDGPKIAVIMTSFNSSALLQNAVASVLAQTHTNLSLYIVDDCSVDGSRDLILALSQRDDRIRYLFNERNIGTYASKNRAIELCDADYVTFHDSDDWMHPYRLEMHLRAMKSNVLCSTSKWIRMDDSGRIFVRRGGPFTHINPASTFFRRDVFSHLGKFDDVRTGADSEILTRVKHRFGSKAIVDLSECLALGLHHEGSLTQSGPAAFDEFRYSPVRLEYTERWLEWHLTSLTEGQSELKLEKDRRPFSIPEAIRP